MTPTAPEDFGRYRLLRPLGRGGMAEVYLAEAVGPGNFRKRVAIKRLLPHHAANRRFVAMMRDEANIAAAIRHPHVAQVLDFGEVGGQHYIAMEFIDGVDLASVLRTLKETEKPVPLDAALYIAACVAHGLHAAHTLKGPEGEEHPVIHRDVSPHNVLVSYEGAVKLIDFGVAKAKSNSTKTRSGVIKGKLQYMSPEQAQAKSVDARADVFSLGMTLYKILTGRLPFTGQNEYQIYEQILRKNPVRPRALVPELPAVVDAIVLKALRKDPGRRFQTAGEMADVLDHALAQINPYYGPQDLGNLMGAQVPRTDVQEADDDDDFFSDANASLPSEEAGVDDESIDRLTSIHRLTHVPTRHRPPDPGPPGSRPKERPAPVEDDGALLAKTQALDPIDLPEDELDRALTEARPSSERRLPTPTPVPFNRMATQKARIARDDAPPPPRATVLVADEVSAPSVRTGMLLALRTRPARLAVALLLTLFGFVVALALMENDKPAKARQEGDGPLHVAVSTPVDVAPAPPPVDAAPPPPPEPLPRVVDAAAPDAVVVSQPLDAAFVEPIPPKPKPKRKWRAPRRGYLTVNALPWAHVEVDGVRLKRHTPVRRHPVRPGRHTVRLVGPNGRTWEKTVQVDLNGEVKVAHAFD